MMLSAVTEAMLQAAESLISKCFFPFGFADEWTLFSTIIFPWKRGLVSAPLFCLYP